jgi:selenobiotic family peptide radical SAM maturase
MAQVDEGAVTRLEPGSEEESARVCEARAACAQDTPPAFAPGDRPAVNPSLRIVRRGTAGAERGVPEPAGGGIVLVWKGPRDGVVRSRAAGPDDLLALKLVVEEIDPAAAAAAGGLSVAGVEGAIRRGEDEGLLLRPRSLLRRPADFPRGEIAGERFFETEGFTLQWHLTQACDLHCRHCYDRSPRAQLPLDAALGVLDDLLAFCRARAVRGAVSFSGGNPLLHPDFLAIYRAAVERGLAPAILGNPAARERIEAIVAVRRPCFYQVSLEGLPEHNDRIRGAGHFDRTVRFLETLRELGVSSMVMLTLTDENLGQVLPLADRLRGLVDDFHFNRLAMVGEGASLRLPGREAYERFLEAYLDAAAGNRMLGIKDNLFNIVLRRRGRPPFGGCTGFGCGAAFNFLALLPDGEAHACRKFPSPVGNLVRDGLAAVYDSPAAARHRAGCAACAACAIRPVCGGCLAVARGFGLDGSRERDPLCFLGEA